MSALSGIDVIVVSGPVGGAVDRCVAMLRRQGRPAASITIVHSGPLAEDGLPDGSRPRTSDAQTVPPSQEDGRPGHGLPRWSLVARASDAFGPAALVEIESITDTLRPGSAVLLRCVPVPGDGSSGLGGRASAALCRPLVHRSWPGWADLLATLEERRWPDVVELVAAAPGTTIVDLAEVHLAPLGEADERDREGEHPTAPSAALLPVPASHLTIVAVGGSVDLPPQSLLSSGVAVPVLEVGDWAPRAVMAAVEAVTTPLAAFLDTRAASAVLDATFAAKCALRAGAGVRLLLFVPADRPAPRWQSVPLRVGDRLALAGFCAPIDAMATACSEPTGKGIAGVIDHVFRSAAIAGRAAVTAHSFPIEGAGMVHLDVRGLSTGAPAVVERLDRAAGARVDVALARAPHAPASTMALELVGDPIERSVALSSPLAPLPVARWPLRVVIGSIDRWPFTGTIPLRRLAASGAAGPLSSFAYAAEPGEGLLGYFAGFPLVDSASVYDRWAAGLVALRERDGFVPRWARVPDHVGRLFMTRARSTAAVVPEDEAWPTFIVDLPGGRAIGGHPDVVAAGVRAGLAAQPGPAIGRRPRTHLVEVSGLAGTVGFARPTPAAGDGVVIGPSGAWWGHRPDPAARLLVRWRSRGVDRCTTGGLPMVFRGGRLAPDLDAELLGTLGWARAPEGGPTDLVEMYHPRRGAWMVTADPGAARGFGYVEIRTIASLEQERSPLHVPLHTSYDRRRGSHRLHLVAEEASGPTGWANGWVGLATTPRASVEPADRAPVEAGKHAPTPSPGAGVLVAMSHAQHDPTVTTDPWSLVTEGWVCAEVVGYARAAPDEVGALGQQWTAALTKSTGTRLGRLAATVDRRAVRPAALAARAAVRGRRSAR